MPPPFPLRCRRAFFIAGVFLASLLASAGESRLRQFVFIDGAVPDCGVLVKALSAGFEVVVLRTDVEGLGQIADHLDARSGVEAIHVISHGRPGSIQLGNAWLDRRAIDGSRETLARIGRRLAPEADLLLYGCNVAQGTEGRAFLERLRQVTKANVAASTDFTGSRFLGGNWLLEAQTGKVATRALHVAAYRQLLVPPALSGASTDVPWTENDAAVLVASSLTVTDADSSTVAGATVTITNFFAGDVLAAGTPGPFVASYGTSTGVLTLTGSGSLAQMQTALNSVTYRSTSRNPTDGGDTTTRSITFQVDDIDNGGGVSNTVTSTVAVTAVNDAPSVTAVSSLNSYEDGAVSGSSLFSINDPDDAGHELEIELSVVHGTLKLNSTTGLTVTSGANDSAAMTVRGTKAAINAGLGSWSYRGAPDWNGNDSFTLKVNDLGNTGEGGPKTGTATCTLNLQSVNDAPTASGSVALAAVDEDETNPPGVDLHGLVAGRYSDARDSVGQNNTSTSLTAVAIIANASTVSQGSWQYSTDSGSTWTDIPRSGLSNTNAIVLTTGSSIRFVPAADWNGTPGSLTVRLADASYAHVNATGANLNSVGGIDYSGSWSGGTVAIGASITAINDAPVIDAGTARALTAIAEDAGVPVNGVPSGTLVSALVVGISDPDTGALQGIAVIGADATQGTWWFTTDGGASWSILGSPANSAARLLAADANTRLHFQPNANWNGTLPAALTIRAWDRTAGANGGSANIGVVGTGGATPFSTDTALVSLTVNAVNDAPTATNLTQSKTATEGGGAVDLDNIVVSDVDTGDIITATLTLSDPAAGTFNLTVYGIGSSGSYYPATGVWSVTGSVANVNLMLAAVMLTPSADNDQNFTITTRIRDAAGAGPADGTITVAVTPVNDAPTATNLTQSKGVVEGGSAVDLNNIVVTDVDTGDTITATLTLSDPAAGMLSTGIYGTTTSTYHPGTGVWTVTGSVSDVNAALAAVALTPSADNEQNFTISVRVRDTANTGPADGTITITVTPVNDAPTFSGLPASLTITEDTQSQLNLSGNTFADVDSANVSVTLAMTLTSGGTSSGTFSLAAGSGVTLSANAQPSFTVTGSPANVAAYLNQPTNFLYTPAPHLNGAGVLTLTVSANDNDGFEGSLGTVGIDVTAVNDAPTVANNNGLTLDEGALGMITSALLSASDVDDTAGGITFTVTTLPAHGTLIRNGTDLVLGSTFTQAEINSSLIGYQHDGGETTSDSFGFSVEDGGEDGAVAVTGQTFALTITPVNDAPTLTHGGSLSAVDEDTVSPPGAALNGLGITAIDPDADASISGYAIVGNTANSGTQGVWQYSTNAGANWFAIGTVNDTGSALALSAATLVRFVPAGNFNGAPPGLAFRALDNTHSSFSSTAGAETRAALSTVSNGGSTAISANTDTITTSITAINDAPTLAGGPFALTGTDEDTVSSGTAVSTILAGVSHADADAGALSGIAITASTGNGTWQYSTDGNTWNGVAPVAPGAALLLSDTSRVRYVPDGANGETATLTFRAWDQTSGTASTNSTRNPADTTANGGATAFSSGTASASIVVANINDAPALSGGPFALTGTDEDTASSGTAVSTILAGVTYADIDAGALSGFAITASTGNGAWQYSTDGNTWTGFGTVSATGALLLTSTTQVRYVPDGIDGETATFTFRAWDQTSGTASVNGVPGMANPSSNGGASAFSTGTASANIAVTGVNDAPVITAPASIAVTEDMATPLTGLSFADVDAGAGAVTVTLSVPSGSLAAASGGNVVVGGTAAARTLTGSVADINAFVAANNLTYATASNAIADVILTVDIDDDGNTGSGGAQTDSTTVTLEVTPVADIPSVTPATTTQNTQTSSGLVISRNVEDGAEVTHFKITAIVGGILFKNDGTTPITSGSFITADEAAEGLKFTPANDASTQAGDAFSFEVQAATDGAGAGLSLAATAMITVNDETAPSVLSIVRRTPATVHTDGISVVWRVTFKENVTGADAADFVLTVVDGSASGSIASVSEVDQKTYDVTVNAVTGQGWLRLDLEAADTGIADVAGNAIADGFTAGDFYIAGVTNVLDTTLIPDHPSSAQTISATNGVAQRFKTSANEPLTLTTVAAELGAVSGAASQIRLFSDDDGNIDEEIATFTLAGTLTQGTLNVWKGSVQMEPGTFYWIVFTATSGTYELLATDTTVTSGGQGDWLTGDYTFAYGEEGEHTQDGAPLIALGATITPAITSDLTASGTYGTAFTYQITATNAPTSYDAAPLPAGLTLDPGTGVISGTPTQVTGSPFTINLSAANGSGTGPSSPLVLTIGQAALTATAVNTTRAYGSPNPVFSISYTGFVNGDGPGSVAVPPVASTGATDASPVGTYPIVLSGGSSTNYTINLVDGTLTITPASQAISFAGPGDMIIGSSATLSAGASSGLPVGFAVVSGPATISGDTLATTGVGTVVVRAFQDGGGNYAAAVSVDRSFNVSVGSAVVETSQQIPAPVAGGTAKLTVSSPNPNVNYQWQRNGSNLPDASGPSLTLTDVQPPTAGLYTYTATVPGGGSGVSEPVIVGLSSDQKVIGAGEEVGADILHPNGNTYDQVLLEGPGATITSDPGQITRISFVDLSNDIVQVEFTGAGTLSVVMDDASTPAPAASYNQPEIDYVKGLAGLVVTGADETSNLTVFSVGRITAVNQSLFREGVGYDGMANIAFIAIQSSSGKFGGVRAGNVHFFANQGFTGVYAPGVEFAGPVNIGDLNAFDSATPLLVFGSVDTVNVTGGTLSQPNDRPVRVSGITQIRFVEGMTSQGELLPAQANEAVLEEEGVDVTDLIVVNP